MITATCGHQVSELDELVYVSLKGYTREFQRCIDYVSYCQRCADDAESRGDLLHDVDEEDAWLAQMENVNEE